MTDSRPPARVRVTGPPRRRHTPRARTGDIDEQTALGDVYLDSLLREQLALAARILGAARPHRRLAAAAVPRLPRPRRGPRRRAAAGLAAARPARLPVAAAARLPLRPPGRAQRARLRAPPPGPRRGRTRTHDHGRRTGAGRAGGGQPRDAGDRHLRAAGLAHHQRLLRRLAQRPARAQRLGDRRRVPLRRVVPRRRRAGAHRRRADALVPDRLDRGLPRAAGPRGRAAAPQRRLHAARLRRGPAGLAAGPRALLGAGRGDRLALPAAPVPGRRAHPDRRDRRAEVGRRGRRRRRRRGQREQRRDAQHHVRPGLPVLAQAHRAARSRPRSCWSSGPATGGRTRPAAAPAGRCRWARAARASTRRTRSCWPPSSAPWGCRTSWSASTPTPTAGPPAGRR